jgi:hypothetical protein
MFSVFCSFAFCVWLQRMNSCIVLFKFWD